MIEQINIALEQKGSEFLSPGSLKPAVGDNVRKKAYTSKLKVMKIDIPRSSLKQDDIVNSLNYEALQ